MDTRLLLFTESTLGTLHTVLDTIGYLADGLLHGIHSNILVEVAENVIQRTLFRHIATDISFLYHNGISTTTDKRGEDILSGLYRQVAIAERIVLYLQLILEEALQLALCLWRICGNTVLDAQFLLTDLTQFSMPRGWQAEYILETVLRCWVVDQEVIQTFWETRDNHNRIVIPFIHLDKELVKGIHLIGIPVRQQLLYIIEEKESIFRLLDIVFPFIDKTLIVDCIYQR